MTLIIELKELKAKLNEIQEKHSDEISEYVGTTGVFDWRLSESIEGIESSINDAITVRECPQLDEGCNNGDYLVPHYGTMTKQQQGLK